jgi:hypothetical protein
MLPYITGLHLLADKFVACYFDYSFGQFPFVYGNPLAYQFDGFFLISLICNKIPHSARFPLEIEGRDANVPTCCHSGTMRRNHRRSIDRGEPQDGCRQARTREAYFGCTFGSPPGVPGGGMILR